ncbi:MAG: dipeptide ABC transporter ATP-binding protein [Chloroflexi bacterium]|nr:dipeptide ABC transporter ATP-binding protein [Chloroflexota bacterium]
MDYPEGDRVEQALTSDQDIVLEVTDLVKHFPIKRGFLQRQVGSVKAVDGVTFRVPGSKTLGLVGESGCGKTTTGRCILRAIEPTAGEVIFHHDELGPLDVVSADPETLKRVRTNVQMIFQDPYGSLNPRMTLLEIVGEPLTVNRGVRGHELEDRVAELLRVVGLHPEYMRRFPHAFSGGQRQRIGIARALALNPQLVVCDEPVSALDVSIQAQTLNLLQDLQEQYGLAYLFVAHDLSVVEHVADAVAVMYVGRLVETAETEELYLNPRHPYTEALLSSVPRPDPTAIKKRIMLEGEVPSPANPPPGCHFHPRCRYATDECRHEVPILREIAPEHFVACHRADVLHLAGVG